MKFISQELENLDFGELLVNLFETSPNKQDTITDSEGNQLELVFEIYTGKKRRRDYLFGRTELQGYFNNYAYDTSSRTVATLATDTGIDITTNLGTFTDTFVFWFHKILGKNTKFISDYWITVYTDEGLRFYKPERDSGSEQISNYQVASRVSARNDSNEFFGSIDYDGESGDIEIAQTSETVIPMTIDDDLKTLAVNKYKSFLERVIIQSPEEAKPLDYIIEDGDVYLIMSKIKNQGGNDYIYTCVKEVDDTYSFSGADVTGLVTTHNADKVDGKDASDFILADGSRELSDDWDAGENEIKLKYLVFYDDTASGFSNLTDYKILMFEAASADRSYGIGVESFTFKLNTDRYYKFYFDGTEEIKFDMGQIYAPDVYSNNLSGHTRRDMYVKSDGMFGYYSSSLRYKENIRELEGTLEKVRKLKVKIYDRIDGSAKDEVGLIAEEVAEVIPDATTTRLERIEKDNKVEWKDTGEVEAYNTTDIVPYLVGAINELADKVDQLEDKIEKLKNKNIDNDRS